VSRLLPLPVLSGALGLAWLALTEISAPHVLLAAILAIGIPLLIWPLVAELPKVQAPLAAFRLLGIVLVDIILANITVARLVLGPLSRMRPGYLEVPLDLTDRHSIALLASIITLTPGTVSIALAPDRSSLLVHALDVGDPDEAVATIKSRYERRIKEVFGC
jgi:multicomponent K+:H+ antiporter subunit E